MMYGRHINDAGEIGENCKSSSCNPKLAKQKKPPLQLEESNLDKEMDSWRAQGSFPGKADADEGTNEGDLGDLGWWDDKRASGHLDFCRKMQVS